MVFRKIHILLIGRVLLLLLFVANSGFTVVLHSCFMKEMACCAMSGPAARHMRASDKEQGAALARPMPGCCAVGVAGGVNTSPIASDRSPHSGVQKLSVVGEIPTLPAGADMDLVVASKYSSHISQRVEPPSVEKYVLNATFLI